MPLRITTLAIAKRESDDLPGAERDAKKAIALDSKYAPAFFNTAEISLTVGKAAKRSIMNMQVSF